MPGSNEELRQRLLGEAQAAMEGMLSDEVVEGLQQGQISLETIERQALAMGRAVGERLTQQMLEEVSQVQQPTPVCPHCGGRLHNKGRKARQMVTQTGISTVQRPYYYCSGCKQGYFPPG